MTAVYSAAFDTLVPSPRKAPVSKGSRVFHGTDDAPHQDVVAAVQGDTSGRSGPLAKAWLAEAWISGSQSWIGRQVEQLARFTRLEKGWDSHNAEPPSSATVFAAGELLEQLWDLGHAPSRIEPSSDASILISFFGPRAQGVIECVDSSCIYVSAESPLGEWEVETNEEGSREALEKLVATLEGRPAPANVSLGEEEGHQLLSG